MYQIFGIVGIFSEIGFVSQVFSRERKLDEVHSRKYLPSKNRSLAKNFVLPELFCILLFIREHYVATVPADRTVAWEWQNKLQKRPESG